MSVELAYSETTIGENKHVYVNGDNGCKRYRIKLVVPKRRNVPKKIRKEMEELVLEAFKQNDIH